MVEQVRDLYDNNYTNNEINKITKLPVSYISDIIRSYKNNRTITCFNLKEDNVENFVAKCKIINGSIFVPILSKLKLIWI